MAFSSSSFSISRYGSTSPKTCEAIGAATPPPWVILTTSLSCSNVSELQIRHTIVQKFR